MEDKYKELVVKLMKRCNELSIENIELKRYINVLEEAVVREARTSYAIEVRNIIRH